MAQRKGKFVWQFCILDHAEILESQCLAHAAACMAAADISVLHPLVRLVYRLDSDAVASVRLLALSKAVQTAPASSAPEVTIKITQAASDQ